MATRGAVAMLEAALVNKHNHEKIGQGDVNKKWNENAIKRGNLPCEVVVGSHRPIFGSDATCLRFGKSGPMFWIKSQLCRFVQTAHSYLRC